MRAEINSKITITGKLKKRLGGWRKKKLESFLIVLQDVFLIVQRLLMYLPHLFLQFFRFFSLPLSNEAQKVAQRSSVNCIILISPPN